MFPKVGLPCMLSHRSIDASLTTTRLSSHMLLCAGPHLPQLPRPAVPQVQQQAPQSALCGLLCLPR